MKFMKLGLFAAVALIAVPANAVMVTSIRVTSAVNNYLQIAELQAFQGLINVAPHGTATATSQLLSFTGAEKVNDGNYDGQPYGGGMYISADTTSSLTLSFTRAYNISRVQIFGREDCCQDRDVYNIDFINDTVVTPAGTFDSSGQGPANTQFANFALAVPEPTAWAMMIGGFAIVGSAARRRKRALITA